MGKAPPLSRGRLLLTAGLGLIFVLISTGLIAAIVPGELAENRAYAAAPPCADGTRLDTCIWTVPATVEGKEKIPHPRRDDEYWLLVAERGTDTVVRVRMEGWKPV
jgi:hypothetical protein